MAETGTTGRPYPPDSWTTNRHSGATRELMHMAMHVFPTPEDVLLGLAGGPSETATTQMLGSFRQYLAARVPL